MTPSDTVAVQATASMSDTTESTTTSSTAVVSTTDAATRVFTIDQSQSEARFMRDEELLGAPKTVVGTTPLVSGEITVDLTDLTKTTLSAIQIDASDLTTDSERRDGAMQRFVLQSNSEEYRYIIFTPTAIAGVPNTASAGETIELQITGDLTISGVTKPVTFATTVTVASDSQINGLATAQVLRSDYNLTIPSVPSVANVTDEVQLQFQFIANAS